MLNITSEKGNISIESDVFIQSAGDAATSCFGVKGMVVCNKEGGPWQLLRRESMAKGVIVHFDDDDDTISLDLHIGVDRGVNISAVGHSIIKEVRYKLENATGVVVKTVNVYFDTIID